MSMGAAIAVISSKRKTIDQLRFHQGDGNFRRDDDDDDDENHDNDENSDDDDGDVDGDETAEEDQL